MKKKDCFIWTRVSTKRQEDNGGSLSDQKSKCEKYAKEHDFIICGYLEVNTNQRRPQVRL